MGKNGVQCFLGRVSTGIGAGILAGIAGTAAITVSQMIEMKITKRKAGKGPAIAVEKTLHVHAAEQEKKNLSQKIHWAYGSVWGVVRGLLGISGMNNWLATTAHFTAITSAAMAIAPLEGQKPVKEWTAKQIGIDIMHHAVYAVAAGLVFDAIYNSED